MSVSSIAVRLPGALHTIFTQALTSIAINIATDLLFAILPIPLVWKLQLTTRTKVGLVCILSLGFFAAATAIYKTPMQYHFFEVKDFTGQGSWYCKFLLFSSQIHLDLQIMVLTTSNNRRLANCRNEHRHCSRLPPNHKTALHHVLRKSARHHSRPHWTHAWPIWIS